MSRFPTARRVQARDCIPRRRGLAWIAAAVLGVTLAVAACSDATGPLPRAGVPDDLEFSIGGFGVGTSTVKLRSDTVVMWRTPWDWTPGAEIDSVRTVPTPDSWRDFWTAAERAGVRRWRRQYMNEAVVDGIGWHVRIAAGGRLIESSGSNAYPDRLGREHGLEMTDDFRIFRTAVGELVGQPVGF